MTFILSCATSEHIFQVSDRRLTMVGGPRSGEIVDDEQNKAVVVGGCMAFGYTGLAKIKGERTDLWLAKTAADGYTTDLGLTSERIRARATDIFRQIRLRRDLLRHAFVGVGWACLNYQEGLRPLLCTITNALTDQGEWLPEPLPEFHISVNKWATSIGGFSIAGAGQTLQPGERYAIWRHIRRCAKKRAGPNAFMWALIDAVLFVSDRYSMVGSSLMALYMPRIAAEQYLLTGDFQMVEGPLIPNQNTFIYLRPGDRGFVSYGPQFAYDGYVLSDFQRIDH